jgi:hypothetical protein
VHGFFNRVGEIARRSSTELTIHYIVYFVLLQNGTPPPARLKDNRTL